MFFANTPDRLSNFMRRLCGNLRIGMRAALLLPIAWQRVSTSWLMITTLMVLTLLPPLATQLFHVGGSGQLQSYGLPGALFGFCALLLFTVVAARLLRFDAAIAPLLVLLVSAAIVIDSATYALLTALVRFHPAIFESWPKLYYLRGIWLGLATVAALLRLGTRPLDRRWVVALGCGLCIGLSVNLVWQDRTLWSYRFDAAQLEARQPRTATITDEVIYRQPQLLADRLAALQPGSDNTELFFLGVAGYGSERVFLREIRSVNQEMLRFARATHSMLLINSTDTLTTDPIASVTSIQQALARIGAVMDRDDDVLFLYLTSHGSEDHRLSLQLPPLKIPDLKPETLRTALDDAGIGWRVIVISACYSGGFIEALEDERTLVITAAAKDRTSFGCSDENDYTYFGRAYFEQALRETDSFIEAFERAREIITAREHEEGITPPSEPQIAIGAAIADKLATLPAPLPASPVPTPVTTASAE